MDNWLAFLYIIAKAAANKRSQLSRSHSAFLVFETFQTIVNFFFFSGEMSLANNIQLQAWNKGPIHF